MIQLKTMTEAQRKLEIKSKTELSRKCETPGCNKLWCCVVVFSRIHLCHGCWKLYYTTTRGMNHISNEPFLYES